MRGPITALDGEGEEIEIAPDEDGELVAYVFKTLADPYAGRLNLFRVYSGVLKGDSQVTQRHPARQGADRPAPGPAAARSTSRSTSWAPATSAPSRS